MTCGANSCLYCFFKPSVRLMLREDIVEVFYATLLDSSEYHLHYYDFSHSLNYFLFIFGHSTKLIFQKFRHLFNYLFSTQAARELQCSVKKSTNMHF